MFPPIRPKNGLMLIAVQSAVGSIASLDPTVHAVPVENGSVDFTTPYTNEAADEVNGSLVASAPMIIARAATVSFRSRIKGAGNNVTYTSSVKPPLHNAFAGCGIRGYFQAAVSAAALSAGSATTGTFGTGYTGTAQLYRGMPAILSVGPGADFAPFITDFTSGKVGTFSETFSPALDNTTLAAIPANWTYAGTSPADNTARLTDQPVVTIGWYEDGNLYTWMDCRGTLDIEGNNARPAFGAFSFSGTYMGGTASAVPSNAVVANHSAPMLVKGAGSPPVAVINRVQLPISRFALRNGGQVETPDDPNTPYGFADGQIVGRTPMFECDPLRTLVSTRDAIAEIGALSNYPIALRFGTTVGNRWGLVIPLAQPVSADNAMRGSLRADSMGFQLLNPGKDAQTRDGERILVFY
jgi:hypothetical protein